mmetsp:Transcript_95185/g.308195  ORF Transcript_95185/g.308195 Transcript_95185/m.308195 type:complete len:313 (-) Transcript_95185:23-961(-)
MIPDEARAMEPMFLRRCTDTVFKEMDSDRSAGISETEMLYWTKSGKNIIDSLSDLIDREVYAAWMESNEQSFRIGGVAKGSKAEEQQKLAQGGGGGGCGGGGWFFNSPASTSAGTGSAAECATPGNMSQREGSPMLKASPNITVQPAPQQVPLPAVQIASEVNGGSTLPAPPPRPQHISSPRQDAGYGPAAAAGMLLAAGYAPRLNPVMGAAPPGPPDACGPWCHAQHAADRWHGADSWADAACGAGRPGAAVPAAGVPKHAAWRPHRAHGRSWRLPPAPRAGAPSVREHVERRTERRTRALRTCASWLPSG